MANHVLLIVLVILSEAWARGVGRGAERGRKSAVLLWYDRDRKPPHEGHLLPSQWARAVTGAAMMARGIRRGHG
jgi:hypothetical protein